MKKFIAEDAFWDVLPQASLGVVVARDMKPEGDVPEGDVKEISQLLAEAISAADHYLVSNTISQNPAVAVWRDAYAQFKTKKGARASVENLLKRVLKGSPVGHIAPSVDIYNAISMKYAFCVGGEDLDSLAGDMRLGIPGAGLAFVPLGEDDDDPTLDGEVCYYDDEGAVCRCWNWRDGKRTAITEGTRNAFFVIENCDSARLDDVREATEEFARLMERYLGAIIAVKEIITADNREVVIER